jgi:hypothetical protein
MACLAGCAPTPVAVAEPPPPPSPAEEPLPSHWIGAFSMVDSRNAPVTPQYQIELGRRAPNFFRARRGCYTQEGWLKRRGEVWIVEKRGGIQVDRQCLVDHPGAPGSPDKLFDHREVTLSPPGGERWIAEGAGRWIFIMNPPSQPRMQPPDPRPAPPAPRVPRG